MDAEISDVGTTHSPSSVNGCSDSVLATNTTEAAPSVSNDFGAELKRGYLKRRGMLGWKSLYVVLDQGLLRF